MLMEGNTLVSGADDKLVKVIIDGVFASIEVQCCSGVGSKNWSLCVYSSWTQRSTDYTPVGFSDYCVWKSGWTDKVGYVVRTIAEYSYRGIIQRRKHLIFQCGTGEKRTKS